MVPLYVAVFRCGKQILRIKCTRTHNTLYKREQWSVCRFVVWWLKALGVSSCRGLGARLVSLDGRRLPITQNSMEDSVPLHSGSSNLRSVPFPALLKKFNVGSSLSGCGYHTFGVFCVSSSLATFVSGLWIAKLKLQRIH